MTFAKEIILKIEIPSKTFLWGEYAALEGGCAGVVCTKPHFIFCSQEDETKEFSKKVNFESFKVHPQSPSGIFLTQEKKSLPSTYFQDPFYGAGGFGRSTAEFLSVYLHSKKMGFKDLIWESNKNNNGIKRGKLFPLPKEHQSLRTSYLKTFSEGVRRPSAYDLMAQSLSGSEGCVCFEEIEDELCFFSGAWPFSSLCVLLFKTDHKVKTHDHLTSIRSLDCKDLKEAASAVSQVFLSSQSESFLKALKTFDIQRAEKKLILPSILDLCASIHRKFQGTYARGCGALGADVIAVFISLNSEDEKSSINALKTHLTAQWPLKFVAQVGE